MANDPHHVGSSQRIQILADLDSQHCTDLYVFFYLDLDLAALSAFRAKSRKLKISKSLQKRE